MEEVHPNLYFYFPKNDVISRAEEIKKNLSDEQDRISFYFQIASLVSQFHDGHTNVVPPEEEFSQYKKGGGVRFPLEVRCDAETIQIFKSHTDQFTVPDPKPVYIKSINNHSAKDLLQTFLGLLGLESPTLRQECISDRFGFYLFLLLGPTETFHLTLEGNDGLQEISLPGISIETFEKQREHRPKTNKSPYEYTIHKEDAYAVLDFRSFTDPVRFKSFLKDMFTDINAAGLKKLIVDLRENGGGNSELIDSFCSYITNKPFRQFSRVDLKVSHQIRTHYSKSFPLHVSFPLSLLPARVLYRHPWKKDIGEIVSIDLKPKRLKSGKPAFHGDLFILTGTRTYSSASAFATSIKDHNLGVIIGSPTGGYTSSYGDCYPFCLPHTRLKGTVSHQLFVRPNGNVTLEPLPPDYPVAADPEHPEVDQVMEFAIQLVSGDRGTFNRRFDDCGCS
ncbi:MAG: hypothetical protein JXA11_10875 [Phycisphaerae bacterium]|nr:hypothetical protein [Phycisphaerae bacterium]